MTETLEHQQSPAPHAHRPRRLHQAAAWVGIVAGVVFIVAAIFFTGFVLGHQGGHGWHGGRHMPLHGPGPWQMGPPPGPGMPGPGMQGPGMPGPGMTAPAPNGPAAPAPRS